MSRRTTAKRRPNAGALIIGGLMSASAMGLVAGTGTAHATNGPTAVFTLGVLTVVGNAQDDVIAISRNAAGAILVNGGSVVVQGGTPTVANTRAVTLIGAAGNDTLTFDETNGALPRATVIGSAGNDVLSGASGSDILVGQGGNDTLVGKGGTDQMFGGADNDVLTGGDADDQAFGEAGDDRMVWNPGDDTDLNEGGAGIDTTEVNGGNGNEQFTATANGTRVRFDRLDPAPFAVDMGTTERLTLNANGGDDAFSATGNLAALVAITVDGGTGNDTLLGSNGVDVLLGGDGGDFVDGQQGNDVALMGAGDDTFRWDPGDGSDVVEGQDGADSMLFNGSNAGEIFDTSANGGRIRFTRNVGNIVMDLNDVEGIELHALGGQDDLVVNDLSGTDLTELVTDLANPAGSGVDDAAADTVTVNGTNGDDVVVAAGQGSDFQVRGLSTAIAVIGAAPSADRITIRSLAGSDVLDASGVAAGSMLLTGDMGAGDDVAIGGDGDDTLLGGDGDDVLLGGPGTDTLDGGAGDNVLIDGENLVSGAVAGPEWLTEHTRLEGGRTVLDTGERAYAIPVADLATS
jgi:Ca2+-binding RTX toxin-like protein